MADFARLNAAVIAASVDDEADARPVADQLSFPVAFSVSRDDALRIGAFWDAHGQHLQPSEFILGDDGHVIASTYSSSPVGRMDPEDVLALLNFLEKNRTD